MIELIIVGLCLILNALLACLEMAFVSVSRPQLRQMAHSGNKGAEKLLLLRDSPERTLSIIQIGITLVGALSAAVGGAGAEEILSPFFKERFGMGEGLAEAVSIAAVVLPITFLNVVVGELVPKTIALKRPIQIAFLGAPFLAFAEKCFAPAIGVFEWSTRFILKYLFPRLKPERGHETPGISVEIDSLSEHHRQYLMNLAHLETKRIRDIMVPWNQVTTLEFNKSLADAISVMAHSGHSRIPVVENSEIKGFLYSKEFLALTAAGAENWTSVLRPILRVMETDTLLKVMRLMQEKRSHIALVYSADRKLIGIVTLEDIIEEVVGEIYDEDDDGNLKRILASGGKLRTNRFGATGNSPPLSQGVAHRKADLTDGTTKPA